MAGMQIHLDAFVGQPCRSRVAYEFVPKQDYALQLDSVASVLRGNGVFVEIETPYLLMLKISGKDVSLFRSGKIIVKSTQDRGNARRVAEEVIAKMS